MILAIACFLIGSVVIAIGSLMRTASRLPELLQQIEAMNTAALIDQSPTPGRCSAATATKSKETDMNPEDLTPTEMALIIDGLEILSPDTDEACETRDKLVAYLRDIQRQGGAA